MILFPKILLLFFSAQASLTSGLQLKEEERLLEYQARNYTWPRDFYNPPTKGWKQIMDRRFAQIADITNSNERYLAYVQTMTAAIVAPNFTETGWALMRAPESLIDELKDYVREEIKKEEERKKASSGVEKGVIRPERQIPEIEGARPDFILPRGNLLRRVLHELLPMHEEWIGGVKLKPHTAYGFRLYRNSSRLHMHVDRPDTHIISSILHVDHSENSKPWPILIEDFLGNTNEVYLESGDILFYESSKCFHGRPIPFDTNGDNEGYYTSVFSHYYPVEGDWGVSNKKRLESNYAVPPVWKEDPRKNKHKRLRQWKKKYGRIGSGLKMVGTSFKEPQCKKFKWCALEKNTTTVKYYGPATNTEPTAAGEEGIASTNNINDVESSSNSDEL